MALDYPAYLALIALGTVALQRFFNVKIQFNTRLVKTIAIVAIIFVAWDVWAVSTGQWSFNTNTIRGIFIGNQPLEEIAFFFVVPLFYLTVWEIGKARYSKKGGKTLSRSV